MSTAPLPRHALLEHQEDIAFSFIHDELTRDVLEHHGIDPLFFARHFGTKIVEEIVDSIEEESMQHSCITLEVMQTFFQRHHKELQIHDMSLLRKGIKKTFMRFSQFLTADETLKIETLLDEENEDINNHTSFTIDEVEEMREILEDLEHFISKLTVDTFFVSGVTHSAERIVILCENYNHVLKTKPFLDLLSSKISELCVSLRVLMGVEERETFEKIQERLIGIVSLLLQFQEAIECENLLYVKDLDTQIADDIDMLHMLLEESTLHDH